MSGKISCRVESGTSVAPADDVTKELPIFLNPGAGGGAAEESLQAAFRSVGTETIIYTAKRHGLENKVTEVVRAGAKVVGVAGGDGTISAAANALVGTDAALLPIPVGTMNHFAKRYGLASVDAAVLALQRSSGSLINVGSVNDRIFVNNASCGFYPHVVRHRERLETVFPRVPAMWLAGMRVLLELPMMKLEIDLEGDRRKLRTAALWVGIGRNSLRLPLPGDADHEGAVLEVVSGRAQTRAGVILMAMRLLRHLKRGIAPADAKLDVVRARQFAVQSRRSVDIALDGEPYTMRGPLQFAIREKALRVLCLVAPSG